MYIKVKSSYFEWECNKGCPKLTYVGHFTTTKCMLKNFTMKRRG